MAIGETGSNNSSILPKNNTGSKSAKSKSSNTIQQQSVHKRFLADADIVNCTENDTKSARAHAFA